MKIISKSKALKLIEKFDDQLRRLLVADLEPAKIIKMSFRGKFDGDDDHHLLLA